MSNAAVRVSSNERLTYSASNTTKVFTLASLILIKDEADCGATSCGLYLQDGAGSCTSNGFNSTDN